MIIRMVIIAILRAFFCNLVTIRYAESPNTMITKNECPLGNELVSGGEKTITRSGEGRGRSIIALNNELVAARTPPAKTRTASRQLVRHHTSNAMTTTIMKEPTVSKISEIPCIIEVRKSPLTD